MRKVNRLPLDVLWDDGGEVAATRERGYTYIASELSGEIQTPIVLLEMYH